ncbi:MAG: ArsR family transcriptional regulator [Methanosarcina barkeri]|nr:ArsR family transcriptional regulator [Methanosarcina sp. ERenArc_MAG2]
MKELFEKRIIEVKDADRLPEDVLETVHKAMNEDVGEIVSLFKVFADPTRPGKALEVQSLCPCRVPDQKHLALSYHLKLLKEGGLMDSRRERSFQIYDFTEFGSLLLKYIEKQFEKA